MNMMQNSPLLVAQTSPAKNALNFKQPNEMAEKAEEGKSFKQVLSKQVEQEASKQGGDKATNTKGTETAKADTSVNSSVKEESADAQGLAAKVTAKTIEDVTDGEVVLDSQESESQLGATSLETPPLVKGQLETAELDKPPLTTLQPGAEQLDGVALETAKLDKQASVQQLNTPQESDAASLALANMMAAIQPNKVGEQGKTMPTERKDNALSLTKQSPEDVDVMDAVKDDAANVKGKVESPLVERDQLFNSKLANYLGSEKNAKIAQEASGSQLVSGVSPLSTMATQAATRAFSSPVAAAEPVGFSNLIHAAPGKAGWSEAIGQKVVWMVGAAEQSATLTLNPKDLGPLQVIINVNNEKADATFISENPEVRKALEEGMSNLRQSMGQAGVELGQANVNTSKQQQAFQQSNREQLGHQDTANHAEQLTGDSSSRPVVIRERNGLVDTFA